MRKSKKAIAEEAAAAREADLRAALRWTGPVAPDVPIPVNDTTRTTGWVATGDYAAKAWSESGRNGRGHVPDGSASKGGRALYSSPILAWRAARFERERAAAEALRRIDEEIARLGGGK